MAKRKSRDRAAELAVELTRTGMERGLLDSQTAPEFFRRMFEAIDGCLDARKEEKDTKDEDDEEDDE